MKIAIFHNFMDNIGGAEKLTLELAKQLKADIYTTNIDKGKIKKMGFSNQIKNIFSIGEVPINAPFRQQMTLLRFRNLKLDNKYDFYIISGDWAMSGAVNNGPNLWYIHSPIREIYDLYEYTRKHTVPAGLRWIFDIWVIYNRHLNKKYISKVNYLVCNSLNTKNRIRKYLGKKAEIINPGIDTQKYKYKKEKNYWLSVNRLISHKRILMQIKAFKKIPDQKLIIVGSYEKSRHFRKYAETCKKLKTENIEIKSWVSEKQLTDLYSSCKGFITTAKDEDFGMTAIEAMASGKPVIAPKEGGYKETIIDGKTGILIENIDSDKIISAVKEIEKNQKKDSEYYVKDCINQAKEYDKKIFITKIKKIIWECK